MKGLIDTNLLVYASWPDAPEHRVARAFLEKAVSGPERYGITWINVAEFVTVMSQLRPLASPVSPLEGALTDIEKLLSYDFIEIVTEGKGHWECFKGILRQTGGVKGRFVHDCRIAAIMMENGVDTIFTRDSEFRRIPGIKVVDPIVTNAVP